MGAKLSNGAMQQPSNNTITLVTNTKPHSNRQPLHMTSNSMQWNFAPPNHPSQQQNQNHTGAAHQTGSVVVSTVQRSSSPSGPQRKNQEKDGSVTLNLKVAKKGDDLFPVGNNSKVPF